MKYSISYRIFSVALAVLVLISTLSFTVEQHFCGDTLVDTAMFASAKKCGMEKMNQDSYVKKPCCKDTVDIIEGQDELNSIAFDDLEFSQQQFIRSYVYSFTALFESLPKKIIPHKDYSPPNIVTDIQVLDEVFLI